MSVSVLHAILLTVISISLIAAAFPWVSQTIGKSEDSVEVSFIKSQFEACNEKILETARMGTANKCFFNIKKGELFGSSTGLIYRLTSNANICDQHPFTLIDERRHIYQECNVTQDARTFMMMWMFPSELEVSGSDISGSIMTGETSSGDIAFDPNVQFITLTVYVNFEYNPGETGHIVDMSRVAATEDDVTLRIKMY